MFWLFCAIPSFLGLGSLFRPCQDKQDSSTQLLCCPPGHRYIPWDVLDRKMNDYCKNIIKSSPDISNYNCVNRWRYCKKRFINLLLDGFENDIYDLSIMHRSVGSRSITKKYSNKLLISDLEGLFTKSIEINNIDINGTNITNIYKYLQNINNDKPIAILINQEISFIRDNIMEFMFLMENFADIDLLIYSNDDPFYVISNVIFLEIYYNSYWRKTRDFFQFDGIIADKTMMEKTLQRVFNHGYVLSIYSQTIILKNINDIWQDNIMRNNETHIIIKQVKPFTFSNDIKQSMTFKYLQEFIDNYDFSDEYLLEIAHQISVQH